MGLKPILLVSAIWLGVFAFDRSHLATADEPQATTEPADTPAADATTEPAVDVHPTDPALIKTWFAQLADADPQLREQALLSLMTLHRVDLAPLRDVVKDNLPLAPSQAVVLRQIVTQVYLSEEPYTGDPAGFLGIQMEDTTSVSGTQELADGKTLSGVVVTKRMPGFCAAAKLHDGDVILGIIERPNVVIRTKGNLVSAMSDTVAGKTAHLLILRNGNVMKVELTLSAKPIDAQPGGPIIELLKRRSDKADEFWEQTFAPLVKSGVS